MNMKKTIAMLAAVVLAGSMMAGCGGTSDSSSESAAETTTTAAAAEESKAEETAEESAAEEESKAEESKAEETEESKAEEAADSALDITTEAPEGDIGELTRAYTDKVNSNVFTMEATLDIPLLGSKSDMKYIRNGDDFNIAANFLGMNMDIYCVGGEAVVILPDMNAYMEATKEDIASYQVDTYVLQDGAVFEGTEEKDGFTVEKYKYDQDGMEIDTQYFFDDKGELKKVIASNDFTGDITAEYTTMSFEPVEIKLPDTSKYEKYDPENPDPVMGVKAMCSMYGITEDMVKNSGYTYEQLAEMDDDKAQETLNKIAEDNGLQPGGAFGALFAGAGDEEGAAEGEEAAE